MLGFLRTGRLGEWRADWGLDELVDIHEIYSNIGADPLAAVIVDAYSGRTIAQTGQMRSKGETFLMGGRVLEVVWRDRYRLGVRDAPGKRAEETLRFMTSPLAVPLDVSQAVAAHLGVAPARWRWCTTSRASCCFISGAISTAHCWGRCCKLSLALDEDG